MRRRLCRFPLQVEAALPYDAELASRALELRGYAPDAVSAGNNILFFDTGDSRILVDTGNGADSGGYLLPTLLAQGIDPASITDVLLTHAHLDHSSGLVVNGTSAFSSATIHINADEYSYWRGDGEAFNASDVPLQALLGQVAAINDIFDIVRS